MWSLKWFLSFFFSFEGENFSNACKFLVAFVESYLASSRKLFPFLDFLLSYVNFSWGKFFVRGGDECRGLLGAFLRRFDWEDWMKWWNYFLCKILKEEKFEVKTNLCKIWLIFYEKINIRLIHKWHHSILWVFDNFSSLVLGVFAKLNPYIASKSLHNLKNLT